MQNDESKRYLFRMKSNEYDELVKLSNRHGVSASHFIRTAMKHLFRQPDWQQKAVLANCPGLLPGRKPKTDKRSKT